MTYNDHSLSLVVCPKMLHKNPQPDLELLMRDHASEWCMAGKPWRWHHISMCKRLPNGSTERKQNDEIWMEYDGILSQAVWTCFLALVLVFGGYFLGESGFATVKKHKRRIRFKASWWVEPKQCWHPAKHSQGERSFPPGCFPRRIGKQCLENSATFHHFHHKGHWILVTPPTRFCRGTARGRTDLPKRGLLCRTQFSELLFVTSHSVPCEMWGFAVDQIFDPNLFVSFMINMINRAKQQGYTKKAAARLKSKVLNAKSTWIHFSPWNLDTRYTFEPVLFITQVFTPTSAPPKKKGESARKFLRLPVPHLLDQRNCWEDPKHNLQGSRRCFKKDHQLGIEMGEKMRKVNWQSARKVVMV